MKVVASSYWMFSGQFNANGATGYCDVTDLKFIKPCASSVQSVVLCYAVLCCVVLCCAVLCCAVLCCVVLCCVVLCCVVLCCVVLCCSIN
jgi:hypothetical protein